MQRDNAVCVSQSEELEQGVTKRHLAFGDILGCDWTAWAVKENVLEDVIGSDFGEGELFVNHMGDFQK